MQIYLKRLDLEKEFQNPIKNIMCKNTNGVYIIIMMCKIVKHQKLMWCDTIWKGPRKPKYFGIYIL